MTDMSSTDASNGEDMVSEKYLAAFSNRESDIIRSVAASVLAGEVSRDEIAEAVQRASEAVEVSSVRHSDAGADSCMSMDRLPGPQREDGDTRSYDAWTTDDKRWQSHKSDIDIDGHDRETQRLLTNEKILQDDLRNMGLMIEDVPQCDQTLGLTCASVGCDAGATAQTFHGSSLHDHETNFAIKEYRKTGHSTPHQPIRGGAAATRRAQGYAGRASNLSGARPPCAMPDKACDSRRRIRPQSAGPVQPRAQRSSSPRSPLPRVAFLATKKSPPPVQQHRQNFPLVGGLQSELDNNEAYSILGNTLTRAGCIDPGRERDVYVRQVAWMARVNAKAESMRQELLTEEISECTFRPGAVAKPSTPKVSRSAATQHQRKCTSHPLCDLGMQQYGSIDSMHATLPEHASGAADGGQQVRTEPPAAKPGHQLYERGRQRALRLDDKRRTFQLEEEKNWRQRPARQLSPQIYPQGCLLGTVGKPMARANMRAWEHMWDPGVNPTFRPTTNFGARMRNTRRRTKSLGATPERALPEHVSGSAQHLVQTRIPIPCSNELDFREFLERQELHGARRAARVDQIQRDVHRSLSRTVPMAPGTRRLLSKKVSTTSNCDQSLSLEGMVEPYEDGPPDFYTTIYGTGHGPTQRPEYAKESEVKNCLFRPQIRPSSHFRTGRTVEDLSIGDSVSRAAKIEEQKRQKEEMIKQQTPFKPQLFSPSKSVAGVKGRVAADANYLQRCRDRDIQMEKKRQAHQARREEEEMKECTFRPKTGRMPKLIRDLIEAA